MQTPETGADVPRSTTETPDRKAHGPILSSAGGSVVVFLLFHATQNWEEGFETIVPMIVDTDWEMIAAFGTLILSLAAVVAVMRQPSGAADRRSGA